MVELDWYIRFKFRVCDSLMIGCVRTKTSLAKLPAEGFLIITDLSGDIGSSYLHRRETLLPIMMLKAPTYAPVAPNL